MVSYNIINYQDLVFENSAPRNSRDKGGSQNDIAQCAVPCDTSDNIYKKKSGLIIKN